jgi:hypothetical protein
MGKSQCINATATQRIAMFQLAKSIESWKKQFYYRKGISPWDIYELSQHLEEEITLHQAKGLSDEIAFQLATEHLGKPEIIENEYSKLDRSKKNGISLAVVAKLFWNLFNLHKYQILAFYLTISLMWVFFDLYKQIQMSFWLNQVFGYAEIFKYSPLGVFLVYSFFWTQLHETSKLNNRLRAYIWVFSFISGLFEFIFIMLSLSLFYIGMAGSLNGSLFPLLSIPSFILSILAIWFHSRYFLFSQAHAYHLMLSANPTWFPGHKKPSAFEILYALEYRISFRLTSIQPMLWLVYSLINALLFLLGYNLLTHPYKYFILSFVFIVRAICNAIIYNYLTATVKIQNK